eukprot:jgi/Mesen1/5566/ME000280S04673
MQFGGRQEVSLRGSSTKEASRDALLTRAAQERAARSLTRRGRVWRGRRAAAFASSDIRFQWDARWRELRRQEEEGEAEGDGEEEGESDRKASPLQPAVVISEALVRPLLFLLHRPCGGARWQARGAATWRIEETEGDVERVKAALAVLLRSIECAGPRFNFCALATSGNADHCARWRFQSRRLLALCLAVLSGNFLSTPRSFSYYLNYGMREPSAELRLPAMRLAVALTDGATWKCHVGASSALQQLEKAKAGDAALGLVTWLANGNGGLYSSVGNYFLQSCPVLEVSPKFGPVVNDQEAFLVTATAITMALRPLLLLTPASLAPAGTSADDLPGGTAKAGPEADRPVGGGTSDAPAARSTTSGAARGETAGATGAEAARMAACQLAVHAPFASLALTCKALPHGPHDLSNLSLTDNHQPQLLLEQRRQSPSSRPEGPAPPGCGSVTSAVPRASPSSTGARAGQTGGRQTTAEDEEEEEKEALETMWLASNVVALVSDARARAFVRGVPVAGYVRALLCQLAALQPWAARAATVNWQRRRKKSAAALQGGDAGDSDDDDNDDEERGKGRGAATAIGLARSGQVDAPTASVALSPEIAADLGLAVQRWQVLKLLEAAMEAAPSAATAGASSATPGGSGGAQESSTDGRSVTMGSVGLLLSQLLALLSTSSKAAGGGASVSLLNVLAFTPHVLPSLWQWLQGPLGTLTSAEPEESGASENKQLSSVRAMSGALGSLPPGATSAAGSFPPPGNSLTPGPGHLQSANQLTQAPPVASAASAASVPLEHRQAPPCRPHPRFDRLPAPPNNDSAGTRSHDSDRGGTASATPRSSSSSSTRGGTPNPTPIPAPALIPHPPLTPSSGSGSGSGALRWASRLLASSTAPMALSSASCPPAEPFHMFPGESTAASASGLSSLVPTSFFGASSVPAPRQSQAPGQARDAPGGIFLGPLLAPGRAFFGATKGGTDSESESSLAAGGEHQPAEDWNVACVRTGVAGVAAPAGAVLSLFCAAYAHLLLVLDDEEFYDRQLGEEVATPGVGAMLNTVPHVLPFEDRVYLFRELVRADKTRNGFNAPAIAGMPGGASPVVEIAVRRNMIVEDGFAQLNRLGPLLKGRINVSFVSELGTAEAGMDYGGLFKEFLTDLATAAFDPRYGLFLQTETEQGLLYPHPGAASLGHGLPMLEFLGRITGKALYEGVLLDHALAPLFVSKLVGRYAYLDELYDLDREMHRNLMYLKHYEGDAADLALDFTVTEEIFGRRQVVELRPGGADISLLSGGDQNVDVDDLRAQTQYSGGYTSSSRSVRLFWEVVAGFSARERCDLLKFVTSCSRGPLLGFRHLAPPFTIHQVACDTSVFAAIGGQDAERLPSASTCFNMLKLPNYKRASTMRDKLKYAISSNAGFELS